MRAGLSGVVQNLCFAAKRGRARIAVLLLTALVALSCHSPQAVQVWSFRRDPATNHLVFGGSKAHPETGSMACPVSADGYVLATYHGVKGGAAMIRTADGGDVFLTHFSPDVAGFSRTVSGQVQRWTPEYPSSSAVLRLVRAYEEQDLALLKADLATPGYYRLRRAPATPGEHVRVAANPLNGPQPSGTFETVGVTGIPLTASDGFIVHGARPGDSGSPVTDSKGRLAGLLTKVYENGEGAMLTRFNTIPAHEIEAAIRRDREEMKRG